MLHPRSLVLSLASAMLAACAAAGAGSRGYEINTTDLSCDDANRYAQQAVVDMGLKVSDFRKARPGSPGYAKAASGDENGSTKGTIHVACDDAGVHIVPDGAGLSVNREFERGVFLSITGRGDLVVEREGRDATGNVHKREDVVASSASEPARATDAKTVQAPKQPVTPFSENTAGGVEVQVELVRGFATVLDFEANVSAAGLLPVKITVENKTARSYDFDPHQVVLRKDGTADRVEAMTAKQAVEQLKSGSGKAKEKAKKEDEAVGDGVEGLGDIEAASRIMTEREIKSARLEPGQTVSGYLYFPEAKYDRARVSMTDVATGEAEGFTVEF